MVPVIMLHLPVRVLASLAVMTAVTAVALRAEIPATLNINGSTGLIDLPSGESQADSKFTFTSSKIGSVVRGTLTFQFSERLSGSFRFQTWRDWDTLFPNAEETFRNRSMDIRYQILEESQYVPALSVGLLDFTGDGLFASEYIAATKTFGEKLKVTAGIGWGRLGSAGSIGTPFGDRPPLDDNDKGKPNVAQWFRGDMSPFAGVEYKINDRWTFKAEYSTDNYTLEDETRGIFDRDSPFNFGVEYQKSPMFRYGVYSMYGSEIGLALHVILDPKNRLTGGVTGPAPVPVKARPSRSADPEAFESTWVTQPESGAVLRKNLAKRLAVDGIVIENLALTATTAQIRVRGGKIDAGPQVIGRTARAMSHALPASVEVFEIVPVARGMGVSKVTIRRSDLEDLEFAGDNATKLRERVTITDAGPVPANALGYGDLYPKFRWGLKPQLRMSELVKGDLGLLLTGSYDIRPGLVFSGAISKRVFSNVDRDRSPSTSLLQPVRSDRDRYIELGDPGVETLTLAWYARPAPDVYSRVTLGYLELMQAGVSGEVLWKPVDSPLALGVELNYTKQRDTDGGFGFDEYDYDVVTGYVSAYYEFGNGYVGQLDVGRYLAGDVGATMSIDRVFANGWRIGAFATVTDATAEEFGKGAFDKGVRFAIPLNWALGNQGQGTFGQTLRPTTGDGGAKLNVDGRLYNSIRDYHTGVLDPEWGRVWR
jgi:Exopolysaccharide biosynthesis protein YbjH